MTDDTEASQQLGTFASAPSVSVEQAIVMGWLVTASVVLGAKGSTLDAEFDGIQIAFAMVETSPRDMTLGRAGLNTCWHQLAPIALDEGIVAIALEGLEQAKLVSREEVKGEASGFRINVETLFRITNKNLQ